MTKNAEIMLGLELPDATLTVRYRFVHVLYQNVLYGSLAPARKATLSLAVARFNGWTTAASTCWMHTH